MAQSEMISILLTGWQWLTSKAGQVIAIIFAIGAALLLVRKSGSDAEKLKQLEAQERAVAKANERKATIDRMSPSDVRKRLQSDWSAPGPSD